MSLKLIKCMVCDNDAFLVYNGLEYNYCSVCNSPLREVCKKCHKLELVQYGEICREHVIWAQTQFHNTRISTKGELLPALAPLALSLLVGLILTFLGAAAGFADYAMLHPELWPQLLFGLMSGIFITMCVVYVPVNYFLSKWQEALVAKLTYQWESEHPAEARLIERGERILNSIA